MSIPGAGTQGDRATGATRPGQTSTTAAPAPLAGSARHRRLLLGLAITVSLPTVLWATAVWATRTMEANELAALGPLWVVLLAVGSVLELGALVIVGLLASLDGVAPNAAERRMLVIALGAIDLCARTLPLLVRNDAGDPHAHPGWALSTLATGAALSWWLSALLTASHSVTMLPWAMVAAAGLHGAVEAMTGANLPVLPMLAGFFVTFEVLRVRAALPWTL